MSNTEFLEELKLQFQRFINHKERLDNKANNMIAMTGTIAILFMGFGIFLLTDLKLSDDPVLFTLSAFILMAEVIFTFFTIKYALDSYKLREYDHPVSYEKFYKNGKLDESVVQQFKDLQKEEINEYFVDDYLNCIKSYETQNELQTKGINTAQKTFLCSIVLIPIFSALVIAATFFNF